MSVIKSLLNKWKNTNFDNKKGVYKFHRLAAQGDMIIQKIDKLPENLVRMAPENGHIVVAHSETGHNHVMLAERVDAYVPSDTKDVDLYEMFLLVKEPTTIDHLRSYDTHAPILVDEGVYHVRRQREYTPEGFRRAAD